MTGILSREEIRKKVKKEAEVTFKIISRHIEKLESNAKLLRRIFGNENTTVSSIQKNVGEDHFYIYVNVLKRSG